MKKNHIDFIGYIRFKNGFEINWSYRNWALPIAIDIQPYCSFVQVLFVTFFIVTQTEEGGSLENDI
jgi:hypothetical protein